MCEYSLCSWLFSFDICHHLHQLEEAPGDVPGACGVGRLGVVHPLEPYRAIVIDFANPHIVQRILTVAPPGHDCLCLCVGEIASVASHVESSVCGHLSSSPGVGVIRDMRLTWLIYIGVRKDCQQTIRKNFRSPPGRFPGGWSGLG
jgi:hypothetical protein